MNEIIDQTFPCKCGYIVRIIRDQGKPFEYYPCRLCGNKIKPGDRNDYKEESEKISIKKSEENGKPPSNKRTFSN